MEFHKLKEFNKIIVTGPQRSGTRITSKIIADVIGYEYVDEKQIGFDSLFLLYKRLISDGKMVIQAPCLSSIIAFIDTPSTAIVFSKRNIKEIEDSLYRVKLESRVGDKETKRYFCYDNNKNYEQLASIAVNKKYDAWEKDQKPLMKVPYFESNYEELSFHPLWIEKAERKKFFLWQTYKGQEPVMPKTDERNI